MVLAFGLRVTWDLVLAFLALPAVIIAVVLMVTGEHNARMRYRSAEKLDALRPRTGRHVSLVLATGRLDGVIRDVGPGGLMVESADGRQRFVRLGDVLGIDAEGTRIADWTDR